MRLKQLGEIVWRFAQEGRAKVSEQTFTKADVKQMCKLAFSNDMRLMYYQSKGQDENGVPDTSFSAPLLTLQTFDLSDAGNDGMRRANMDNFDLFRLPKHSHITNIYPAKHTCGHGTWDITLVEVGEENFYRNDPNFSKFYFGVVKGRGINLYNIPLCVKSVDVEATFDLDDELEVSMDVAFNVANQVLGEMLRIPDFIGKGIDNTQNPAQRNLKSRIAQAPEGGIQG